eukprot:scaffold1926_cov108-Cylindrotheca_fusiformis.AAC.2
MFATVGTSRMGHRYGNDDCVLLVNVRPRITVAETTELRIQYPTDGKQTPMFVSRLLLMPDVAIRYHDV